MSAPSSGLAPQLRALALAAALIAGCSNDEASELPSCEEMAANLRDEGTELVLCEDSDGNRIELPLPPGPAAQATAS